jgi:hypothetical protein
MNEPVYGVFLILLLVGGGVILPIALLYEVFLRRSRVYPPWAKGGVVVMCLAAGGWCTLSWVLLRWQRYGFTNEAHRLLEGIRGWFAGISLGILFTIRLARPYRDKADKQEHVQPPSG